MTTTPERPPASGPGVRLGHVALAVASPARVEAFYRDLVGLPVVRRGGNAATGDAVLFSGRPAEDDHELVLLSNPQAAHVAFRVPTRAALAGFYHRALAAAVPTPLPPQDVGSAWSVFVTDPEGNLCEVYWATGHPAAEPRPLDPTVLHHPAGDDVPTPDAAGPAPGGCDRSQGRGSGESGDVS
jgi:catechol-2,3-dioxygenase